MNLFWEKTGKKEKDVRKLSEKEIQRQLYGDYRGRVEVMDSSYLSKQNEEEPIREKVDAKAKKEINSELEALKSEFKRLESEVNRLKKDKKSLERPEVWFRPPLLKTRQLVIIGSVTVIIIASVVGFFAVRFFVSKVNRKPVPEVSKTELAKEKPAPAKKTDGKKRAKRVSPP